MSDSKEVDRIVKDYNSADTYDSANARMVRECAIQLARIADALEHWRSSGW